MASRTHEVYFVHAAIWWTNIDATQGNEDSKPPIVAVLDKNIDPTKYCQAHFGELVTVRKHNGLGHNSTDLTRSEL